MDVTPLLRTLKYSEEEIKTEKGRVQEALTRCKLVKDEDIDAAQANLKRYLTTEATYKLYGIILKRFTDMMLAKDEGKKLVYLIHEEIPQIMLAFLLAMGEGDLAVGKEKLVIEIPESILWPLFGGTLFPLAKMTRILEYAEEAGMDITAAHCPVDKLALGAMTAGLIPKPDFITSSAVHCDQGAKQCEVMGELNDIPYYIITDNVRDEPWGYFPELHEDGLEYFGRSMQRHFEAFGKAVGVELTEEYFHKARIEVAKLWFPLQQVIELVAGADRRPISYNDEGTFYQLTMYPDWRIEELSQTYQMLISEIKDKIANGEGVVPKGAPRVAFGNGTMRPDITELCEKELGLNLLPGGANLYWIAPFERIHKFPKDYNQYVRFAEAYMMRGVLRCRWGQVYRAIEVAKHFKLDGFIAANEYGCRPLSCVDHWIKDAIEKEVGIPAMDTDVSSDPRVFTPDQMRTKLETFAALVKIRKAARARAG